MAAQPSTDRPSTDRPSTDRRRFLLDSVRVAGVLTLGSGLGFLAGARGRGAETRWQIDPNKCVGCGNCATNCVLDQSAVRCVQCFDMCGYCDICTGYLDTQYQNVDTAAENQLCPTGAILRQLIEEKAGQRFYEYTIDVAQCIGCGVCVKGCALMNGSLYLQVMHDLCKNCNECAIAVSCPSCAFDRLPMATPYRLKQQALALVRQKAGDPANVPARALLEQVYQP